MEEEVKIGFRDRILMNVPLKQKMLLPFYGSLVALILQIYIVWSAVETEQQSLMNNDLQRAVLLIENLQGKGEFSANELRSLFSASQSNATSISIVDGNAGIRENQVGEYIAKADVTAIVELANQDKLIASEVFDSILINSIVFIIIIFVLASSVSANLLPLIDYIIEVMKVIAAGRLDRKVGFSGDDEFGQLGGAIDGTIGNIRELIGLISKSVDSLNESAQQISSKSGNALESVQEQHRQVDMVATAIDELTSSIQDVANTASNADELTNESHAQAQDAKSRIGKTIASIESLSQSVNDASGAVKHLEVNSEKIGSVVSVIQSISEQTNLLALNAAIEAARAGEQGRGFAVVADEVRQLAQRTQDATVEIQGMIEELQSGSSKVAQIMDSSVSYAESGVEQVNVFVEDLELIVNKVSDMTNMNDIIATALNEQTQVTASVNESIHIIRDISSQSLDRIQTTLAGNEHNSNTASELSLALNKYTT